MKTDLHAQHTEILRACSILFAPGQVAELRIFGIYQKPGFSAAGWFNDWNALADAALRYDGKSPEGIYVTLNALQPACIARSNNTLQERVARTSTDNDVIRRHWLPIDVDPIRPTGVSSTEEELGNAKAAASEIAEWLEGNIGLPAGIRASSGNGAHLLYRIDLPNTTAATELVKAALEGIAERPVQHQVKVDKLWNAARIWKLYGTHARKGQEVGDRRHRVAVIEAAPESFEQVEIVSEQLLERLAGLRRPPPAAARKRAAEKKHGPAQDIDLADFVAEHRIAFDRSVPFDGSGVKYLLAACLFDSSHVGTSACLGKAPSGAVFYKCQHDSCSGRTWADVKALFSADRGGRRRASKNDSAGDVDAINPWELAKLLLEEQLTDADTGEVIARRYREQFWFYSSATRSYRPQADDAVRVLVTRWIGANTDKTTRTRVNDTLLCLESLVTTPSEPEMPFKTRLDPSEGVATASHERHHWIALKNGILDLDRVVAGEKPESCLMSHSAEWLSAISLPFEFPATQEAQKCPKWLAFLADVFRDDETLIALLQEAFGYCFRLSAEQESFFILHGAGSNGKSTILNILTQILGEANVSALSATDLTGEYALLELYGKLANICADMNEMDRVEEGLIKKIASGDAVSSNRKYKPRLTFRPTCKLWFSTNILPKFTDTSLGVWRRLKAIPFDRVVTSEEKDIFLGARLRAELPGIFLWAIEGMNRLVRSGEFTACPRSQRAALEYKLHCFPIATFIEECCHYVGECTARELWLIYRKWCAASGLGKIKPLHTFVGDVLRLVENVQVRRYRGRMERETQIFGLSVKLGLDFTPPDRQTSYPSNGEPLYDRNGD